MRLSPGRHRRPLWYEPVNLETESDHPHPHYSYVCPQCGSPTHGSATSLGGRSSYCEDCVGDREIDDQPDQLNA